MAVRTEEKQVEQRRPIRGSGKSFKISSIFAFILQEKTNYKELWNDCDECSVIF